MTGRLRELAERWKELADKDTFADDLLIGQSLSRHACADELLAILDAEGDSGAVVRQLVRTAPEQIYLQISDDESDHEEAFPADHGDEITWCADSVLDCEVRYIRSDLVTRHGSARSGEVSDADVEAACCKYYNSGNPVYPPVFEAMRAALEHFANGSQMGGDVEDAARYRWLRDNCHPGANDNDKPHALVKVCVGTVDNRIGWFSLIGSKAHVGIVTLDQAIDAARKGERHE